MQLESHFFVIKVIGNDKIRCESFVRQKEDEL